VIVWDRSRSIEVTAVGGKDPERVALRALAQLQATQRGIAPLRRGQLFFLFFQSRKDDACFPEPSTAGPNRGKLPSNERWNLTAAIERESRSKQLLD